MSKADEQKQKLDADVSRKSISLETLMEKDDEVSKRLSMQLTKVNKGSQ